MNLKELERNLEKTEKDLRQLDKELDDLYIYSDETTYNSFSGLDRLCDNLRRGALRNLKDALEKAKENGEEVPFYHYPPVLDDFYLLELLDIDKLETETLPFNENLAYMIDHDWKLSGYKDIDGYRYSFIIEKEN